MFKHARTKTRITLVISLLAALLAAVGASGLCGIHFGTRAHERTFANVPQLLSIERQAQALARARTRLESLVPDTDVHEVKAGLLDAMLSISHSDAHWSLYR